MLSYANGLFIQYEKLVHIHSPIKRVIVNLSQMFSETVLLSLNYRKGKSAGARKYERKGQITQCVASYAGALLAHHGGGKIA